MKTPWTLALAILPIALIAGKALAAPAPTPDAAQDLSDRQWRQLVASHYHFQDQMPLLVADALEQHAPPPDTIVLPPVQVQAHVDMNRLKIALQKADARAQTRAQYARFGIATHALHNGRVFHAGYGTIFFIPVVVGAAW